MGNDVLGMADALRSRHAVRIVCVRCAKGIEYTPASDYLKNPPGDELLIYHYAVEWDVGDQIYNSFNGIRILRYHNVTPADLLRPYNRAVATACHRGRERLTALPAPDLLLADSKENAIDYASVTGKNPATEVLPPFSQTELLLSMKNDEKLEEKLKHYPGKRLLYVGRISPHKNVHTLIEDIENALSKEIKETVSDETLIGAAPFRNEIASSHLVQSQWQRLWQHVSKPLRMRFFTEKDRSRSHPVLFIVGTFSPAFPEYNRMVRQAASRCRTLEVIFLNRTSLSQLATLYRLADLFVTASLHEGFCVPVIESMAFDLPMALPDSAVFRETSLGRARYFKRITKAVLTCESAGVTDANNARKNDTRELFFSHYSSAVLTARLLQIVSVIR